MVGLALVEKEALYVWSEDPGDNRCPFSRSSCSPTQTEHKGNQNAVSLLFRGGGHQLSTRIPASFFVLVALLSPSPPECSKHLK